MTLTAIVLRCGKQRETTTLFLPCIDCMLDMMSSLEVKQSGGKLVPQSDLRAGTTLRKAYVNCNLRLGTWNVRTMKRAGKLENLKLEMRRNKIDIIGLSEVRWEGEGQLESEEFTIIYSGGKKGERGVAIVLRNDMANSIVKVITKSDRVMAVKLKAQPVDLLIVQVYMPTSSHEEEEIEGIYEQINEILEEDGIGKINSIVMGDWNSIVGEGEEGNIIGKYGLGKRNHGGDRLVEFCSNNNLIVTNTWFENHKRRLYTWKSPGDKIRCQLDYILVKQRFRNCVKKVKTLPGADIDSDHILLITDIATKLKQITRTRRAVRKWDLEALKQKKDLVRTKLEDAFASVENIQKPVDAEWTDIKGSITKVMRRNIGKLNKKIRKPWITQEMIAKMEERRKWKNVQSEEGRQNYKRINNELRRVTDKAKENWLYEQCREIENMERLGRYDQMYAKAKELDDKKVSNIKGKGIRNKNGKIVSESKEVIEVWEDYIQDLYGKPSPELNIEEEEEINVDNIGPSILQCEVEKAIKELKVGKATGSDDIPAEILKILGSIGIKMMTKLVNRIYDTGEWPEDFIQVQMVPMKKKTAATNCNDYRTISILSHSSKVLTRILMRRLEKKAEENIGEDQFGFRKGKGARDAIGVMRIITERTIEYDQDCCVCFVDWQKAFDRVNWSKLLGILKDIGLDWKDRRLIRNLYVNQTVKVRLEQDETRGVQIGRGVRQGCCLSPILFNIYAEQLIRKSLEGIGDFKIGGRTIKSVKYADDQVIIANSERELQKMINRLNIYGREYGMSINIDKTKVMRIGRTENKLSIRINGKQIEQVENFQYLGSILARDGNCTMEIRSRIAKAKAAFNRKRTTLTSKIDENLRKKLVRCYVWSIALYGSETWTLRKKDIQYLESFEMWTWRRMQKIKWTDKIRNEEVLQRIGEIRKLIGTIRRRKANWIGHHLRRECMIKEVIEGKLEGRRAMGRKRFQLIDELRKNKESYQDLKTVAGDRKQWRARYNM